MHGLLKDFITRGVMSKKVFPPTLNGLNLLYTLICASYTAGQP